MRRLLFLVFRFGFLFSSLPKGCCGHDVYLFCSSRIHLSGKTTVKSKGCGQPSASWLLQTPSVMLFVLLACPLLSGVDFFLQRYVYSGNIAAKMFLTKNDLNCSSEFTVWLCVMTPMITTFFFPFVTDRRKALSREMEKEGIIPLSHPVRPEDATRTQVLWIAGDKFTVRESKRARMKYTASQCGGKRGSAHRLILEVRKAITPQLPKAAIVRSPLPPSPPHVGTDRRMPLFALPARGRGERPGREPHRSPPPGSPAQQFNKVCFLAHYPFGGCHPGKWLSLSVCGCRFGSGVGVEWAGAGGGVAPCLSAAGC
nr:uncharacterized protein LOC125181171 [Anser cygnoides]